VIQGIIAVLNQISSSHSIHAINSTQFL